MSQAQASPAWASTAVAELLCGRVQDATVFASTGVASYLSVPEPRSSSLVIALLTRASGASADRCDRRGGGASAGRGHRADR